MGLIVCNMVIFNKPKDVSFFHIVGMVVISVIFWPCVLAYNFFRLCVDE